MPIDVFPVTVDDIDTLATLARRIWQATYSDIISQAQIDYMLAQRYAPQRLREELSASTIWWDQVRVDGRLAGFASCVWLAERREMKLDKLYVDPDHQRQGLGERLLAAVTAHALAAGCHTLILAVNKRNTPAIAAYRRYGFVIREEVCIDIGGGFVMDDYVMARPLVPAAESAE
ncbi:MAG TPA: GNAT family N-acetyltransferase [Accumulibacter sp.]|nr:GNAT family N-acetyltransferase [Accumulibacter sp.]HMW16464.1 GNAT family N-acetyltransferase [Accumulibacter sp.]HMX22627.1 GNAT family N-acetyltransferase [Accumulibacter sp.]HMY05790.1 GNAT family N-acetyltransferase [Accumulibacter sp.]HNC16867.1 GNAT family N-acetyltransferase [Accumulibacter sp.]